MLKTKLLMLLLLTFVSLPSNAIGEIDYLSFATDDEANSVEIFQKSSPAVVFVTNTALRRSLFSPNIQEIPRGAGSGFISKRNITFQH